MEIKKLNEKLNHVKEWRKFGIGLSIGLTLVGTLHLFKSGFDFRYYSAAGALVLIAFLAPVILKPVFFLFSYVLYGLSWVISKIILLLLFYLVFTPVGFIYRLKDQSANKINADTYWNKKENPENLKEYYENQF